MQPEEDRSWASRTWLGEHEFEYQPSISSDTQHVESPEQALCTWHIRETTALGQLRPHSLQHPTEVQERLREQIEEEKDEEEHL